MHELIISGERILCLSKNCAREMRQNNRQGCQACHCEPWQGLHRSKRHPSCWSKSWRNNSLAFTSRFLCRIVSIRSRFKSIKVRGGEFWRANDQPSPIRQDLSIYLGIKRKWVHPRAGSIYLVKTSILSSCSLAVQFWVENILISKHGSLWTPEH
jgi:hypothetical protein